MLYISTTQSLPIRTTSKQNRIELATQSYFTWYLSNRSSFQEWWVAPDDWSTSPYYSAFTMSWVSSTASETYTGSVVQLALPQGEFHYEIYQTANPYDLGLTSSYGLVEEGLLIVLGTSSLPLTTFTQSNDDTIKVYRRI